MSKSAPVKFMPQAVQKNPQPVATPHKSGLPMPAVRDVNPVPSIRSEQQNTLVAYKDLNQNVDLQLQKQRNQLYFAFGVFALIGFFILIGQVISKPRMVAASQVGFEVQAIPTHVEHYQYDKSCYKGDDGEQVCVTRTSKK
jgi:hypothetical protein